MNMLIRIPVVCQNGHEAFWYIRVENLDCQHLGVPEEEKCKCPKFNLGEGYRQAGKPLVVEEES